MWAYVFTDTRVKLLGIIMHKGHHSSEIYDSIYIRTVFTKVAINVSIY